jgi:hypothetical protein
MSQKHKSKTKESRPGEARSISSIWGKFAWKSAPKRDEEPNRPSHNDSELASSPELGSSPESSTLADPTDLCLRAEQLLIKGSKTKQIWQSYLEILREDMPQLEQNATGDRQKQLSELLDVKTKELEARRTKIEFGDYELKISNALTKIFKTILSAKDLINSAATPSPPAQLACAGVFVVLTVSSPYPMT